MSTTRQRARVVVVAAVAGATGLVFFLVGCAALLLFIGSSRTGGGCGSSSAGALAPVGPGGEAVGASEYGGPGDPSSGTVGASGASLLAYPDSYAELGGMTVATATMMGGLPYMTPLRITWGGHSAVAYKRDFGLGGGPVDGRARVIDLWWQFAGRLG